MTTYERIKDLADKRGWSLQELADKSNIGTNSIYKWKVQTPKIDKLTSVAKALGVTVDYLLGTNDTPDWANEKDTHDLKEFLDNNADSMTFEGEGLTEVEKEKLKIAMTQIFWDRHKHN